MRILYLCSDPGVPVYGTKGASVHVRELCRALIELGHEVLLIAAKAGPCTDAAGFAVEEAPLGPSAELLCESVRRDHAGGPVAAREVRAKLAGAAVLRRARDLCRTFAPDVIYERYSLFGTAGRLLSEELRLPLVLEVNAPLTEEQAEHRGLAFRGAAERAERAILGAADRIIAVSPPLATWLSERGVEAGRVTVLPNAVDPGRFRPQPEAAHRVRRQLGLNGQPVLGFLGTLKPWHDAETLLEALAHLPRALDARLLVVGDGPERAKLEVAAARLGVCGNVEWTGAVPHDFVPAYLSAMDVAVVPYADARNFYFSPLKLFEYQAAARPVVAADIGELRHCVRPGDTGLLYPPGDARGLANALSELAVDRGRARRLGRAGRRHVLRRHTWIVTARAVAELAGDAAERRRS